MTRGGGRGWSLEIALESGARSLNKNAILTKLSPELKQRSPNDPMFLSRSAGALHFSAWSLEDLNPFEILSKRRGATLSYLT